MSSLIVFTVVFVLTIGGWMIQLNGLRNLEERIEKLEKRL